MNTCTYLECTLLECILTVSITSTRISKKLLQRVSVLLRDLINVWRIRSTIIIVFISSKMTENISSISSNVPYHVHDINLHHFDQTKRFSKANNNENMMKSSSGLQNQSRGKLFHFIEKCFTPH